jgi:hypothetical protein
MHKMVNWLECLRMHRVNLRQVMVQVYDDRDKKDVYYMAEHFLSRRGWPPVAWRVFPATQSQTTPSFPPIPGR